MLLSSLTETAAPPVSLLPHRCNSKIYCYAWMWLYESPISLHKCYVTPPRLPSWMQRYHPSPLMDALFPGLMTSVLCGGSSLPSELTEAMLP